MKIYPHADWDTGSSDGLLREIDQDSMEITSKLIEDTLLTTPALLLPIDLRADISDKRRTYILIPDDRNENFKLTWVNIMIKETKGYHEILFSSDACGCRDVVNFIFHLNDYKTFGIQESRSTILNALQGLKTPGIKWISLRHKYAEMARLLQRGEDPDGMEQKHCTLDSKRLVEFLMSLHAITDRTMNNFDKLIQNAVSSSSSTPPVCQRCGKCCSILV